MAILKLTKPENPKQLIVLLVISCAIFLLTFFYQISQETEFYDKYSNQTQMLSDNLATSLLYRDLDETNEILNTLEHNTPISLACVFNDQGLLIASRGTPSAENELRCGKNTSDQSTYFYFSAPIRHRNQTLGKLELHISKNVIYLNTFIFMLILSLTAFCIWAINAYAIKTMKNQINSYERKLQKLINKRDDIINEEHRRIAIEIHDQIGQLLSSANLNVRYLKACPSEDQKHELLQQTEQILSEVYVRIKNISTELHPAILSFGIQAAIEWLAEQKFKPKQIDWRIRRNHDLIDLEPNLAIILYKISQEAFTNILKHSHANMVYIDLNLLPHCIEMQIRDNGIGAQSTALEKNVSLGLIGISERAKSVNGNVTFVSDHLGTTLSITLPLKGEARGKHH